MPPRASGSWPGDDGDAGVSFDLEPDADRIFRETVASMGVQEAKRAALEAERSERASRREPFSSDARAAGGGKHDDLAEIDLHRLTVAEAIAAVEARIEYLLAGLSGKPGAQATLKIITGKGLHSGPSGAVLPREIHRHVKARYALHIHAIDESPAAATLGGVPLRGHFTVTLRGR